MRNTPKTDWSVVFDNFNQAVLSVWGANSKDVFFAGGPIGVAGIDALALHFDGKSWRRLDASAAAGRTLWWVHGTAHDDVWFVGEHGVAMHYDGSGLTLHETGVDVTLFGVYAIAPNDVWAVGGNPADPAKDQDALVHWDGTKWTRVDPPMKLGITLFKVAGLGKRVFVSGQAGVILEYDGNGGWKMVESGAQTTLFSVAANDTYALAVGGPPFTVLEKNGDGPWTKLDMFEGATANGVTMTPKGEALVVAIGGRKYRRTADGMWSDDSASEPKSDLHAAWIDEMGNGFVVGGNFNSLIADARTGVIGRYGTPVPTTPPTGP
jgi:hypothetical protein